nr:immunoglobulin light chain junction region [Macaca mulatta]
CGAWDNSLSGPVF